MFVFWPAILFLLKKVQVNIICLNFKRSVYFYLRLERSQIQIWYLGSSGQQQLWTEAGKEKAYLPNPKSDKEKALKPYNEEVSTSAVWTGKSLVKSCYSSVYFKALISTYYVQIILLGPQKDLKISGKHSIVLIFKNVHNLVGTLDLSAHISF